MKLTLTAPHGAALSGLRTRVSGRLTLLGGAPIAGAPIELQQLTRADPATIATATTARNGSWSAPVALTSNALLRALHRLGPRNDLVAGSSARVALTV